MYILRDQSVKLSLNKKIYTQFEKNTDLLINYCRWKESGLIYKRCQITLLCLS